MVAAGRPLAIAVAVELVGRNRGADAGPCERSAVAFLEVKAQRVRIVGVAVAAAVDHAVIAAVVMVISISVIAFLARVEKAIAACFEMAVWTAMNIDAIDSNIQGIALFGGVDDRVTASLELAIG